MRVNLIHSKLVFFLKKNVHLKKTIYVNSASKFIIHCTVFLKNYSREQYK
jgi:hypothetical protein